MTFIPLNILNLEVADGSPLDFSSILPNPQINEDTRIIVNGDGRLACVSTPDKPVRMLCSPVSFNPAGGGFPDHAMAERYALQLRRHGYNCARFHFLDANLLEGRAADFDYNPDVLDRVHYLMHVLKENGIYWIIDGLTSERGAYAGFYDRWDVVGDLRLKTHLENESFGHWLRFQIDIFCTKNPYTGLVPFEDPALAVVVPYNENSLCFLSQVAFNQGGPVFQDLLKEPFNDWLIAKYSTTSALQAAWGSEVQPNEQLENKTVGLPTNRYSLTERLRDLALFFVDTEVKTTEKMTNCLRALGCRSVIAPYNNWPGIQTNLSRQGQEAIAMNTYHDWIGDLSGQDTILQASSLTDNVAYMRAAAASRFVGRPFIITEYEHLFWNHFRYESGLAMPAYAALQNWDILCRHGECAVILEYGENYPRKERILPYTFALDPVARAGETLAALLFRRGDVAGSANSVVLETQSVADLKDGYGIDTSESPQTSALSLMTAIGLQSAPHQAGDIVVPASRPFLTNADAEQFLRQNGVLDAQNPTNANAGIYVSDTKQIHLNSADGMLKVITPHTEAIAYSGISSPVNLGVVQIWYATAGGLFAISALDGLNVADSKRLLIIYATDAQNTGMTFTDATEKTVTSYGDLPVRIKMDYINFALPGTSGAWKISPVMLDGSVSAPTASGTGIVNTELWTNASLDGPTTYFLIERE
ncbi:glycoside hydrolase [Ochrobactrum sp. MR28]|nr:glycoside hydrolase [Ochrobactrum sp. MR28]MBX8818993.1 glycoside hydrolase [Ochrobactrum sp. MR31]